MKNRKLELGTLACCSMVVFGCSEDVDSDDVRTSGLYAEFDAVAEGDGSTRINAWLKIGGSNSNTFADLQGDDRLLVSTEEEEKTMARKGSKDRSPYEAELDTEKHGTEIYIALERGGEDDSAPDSSAILPRPFTASFSDMEEGDAMERGNDIRIEWNNDADNRMYWQVEGECVETRDGSLFDVGSMTIDERDIAVKGLDEGEDCEVVITLERIDPGSIDPAFGGGEFNAIQRRTLSFRSLPAQEELGEMGGSNGGS